MPTNGWTRQPQFTVRHAPDARFAVPAGSQDHIPVRRPSSIIHLLSHLKRGYLVAIGRIPHLGCSVPTGGDNTMAVWGECDMRHVTYMAIEYHHSVRCQIPHASRIVGAG